MTIQDILPKYYEFKLKRVKVSTLSAYQIIERNYISPYFKGDISSGITHKQIVEFVDLLFNRGLGLKTVKDIITVLKNILNYCNMNYDVPLHTWKIDWPSINLQEARKIKFFTKEECKKVFDYMEVCPDPKTLGLIIGFTTGMRIGEICGLRFSDVDFDHKTIHVQRTIQRVHHKGLIPLDGCEVVHCVSENGHAEHSTVLANKPKTIDSDRFCPLAKEPFKWIKKYSAVAPQDGYLLTLKRSVMEPRTYRNYYYKTLKAIGLPLLNPHCMRHTFATQLLHNKVDVATIASILGHSSPAITLEIYSHTNEEEKAKAVNGVFGKLFK